MIRRRLDLLIRLIDTTTGLAVSSQSVVFKKDGKVLPVRQKGEGNYIFIDIGRENSFMELSAYGYDPQVITLDYETLDPNLPSIDVFLIPSENTPQVRSLTGKVRGLTSVEAVQLGKPVCSISEFEPKDNRMTLFLPNKRMNMEDGHYGLLHEEKGYEHFVVKEQRSPVSVILTEPLAEEFAVNSPIAQVVFGHVDEKGNYTLRVLDSAEHPKYLVRFTTADGDRYKVYDFGSDPPVEIKK